MTAKKDLKRLVRARARKTGESYAAALRHVKRAGAKQEASVWGELRLAAPRGGERIWLPDEPAGEHTRRARRVLDRAQGAVPASFGHRYVGTEHLLLALSEAAAGLAGRVLVGAGVAPADVRAAIEARIGRGDAPPDAPKEVAPRARRVLGLAVDEADRLGHGVVGTGHLLLGLLREGQGIAAGILTERGVDPEGLADATQRALSASTPPPAESEGRPSPRTNGSARHGWTSKEDDE